MLANDETNRGNLSIVPDGETFNGPCSIDHESTKRTIRRIWQDVLETENIETSQNFFEIGGTSLALIRVLAEINEHFGVFLDMEIVAQTATIDHFASSVALELNKRN